MECVDLKLNVWKLLFCNFWAEILGLSTFYQKHDKSTNLHHCKKHSLSTNSVFIFISHLIINLTIVDVVFLGR